MKTTILFLVFSLSAFAKDFPDYDLKKEKKVKPKSLETRLTGNVKRPTGNRY